MGEVTGRAGSPYQLGGQKLFLHHGGHVIGCKGNVHHAVLVGDNERDRDGHPLEVARPIKLQVCASSVIVPDTLELFGILRMRRSRSAVLFWPLCRRCRPDPAARYPRQARQLKFGVGRVGRVSAVYIGAPLRKQRHKKNYNRLVPFNSSQNRLLAAALWRFRLPSPPPPRSAPESPPA